MYSSSDAPLIDALAKCNVCGHLQTNPRLEMENVLSGYESGVDPAHTGQDKFREKSFKRTIGKLNTLEQMRATSNAMVLDIGCASGAFLNSIKKHYSWDGIGVEPSTWMCEFGIVEYNLDLRSGYFTADMFSAQEFDLVTLWDVIEHIPDPNQVLADVAEVMKNNGLMIINVPNSNSYAARLLGKKWPYLLAVHIHYFTTESIEQILEKHGFVVIETHPYFQTLGLGYLTHRFVRILGFDISRNNWFSWLDKISFKYNMGQTTFVSKKVDIL